MQKVSSFSSSVDRSINPCSFGMICDLSRYLGIAWLASTNLGAIVTSLPLRPSSGDGTCNPLRRKPEPWTAFSHSQPTPYTSPHQVFELLVEVADAGQEVGGEVGRALVDGQAVAGQRLRRGLEDFFQNPVRVRSG
jgi:hypothetical protein